MVESIPTFYYSGCPACGKPIQQQPGGHRQRRYCNDACRQRARRRSIDARVRGLQQQQDITDGGSIARRYKRYTPETQALLDEVRKALGGRVMHNLVDAIETEIYRGVKRNLKKLR